VGEQSGLQMHIAATESVLLGERMKSVKRDAGLILTRLFTLICSVRADNQVAQC
jgi:hypothetical protein